DRREDHPVPLPHALLVRAAAPADDPRRCAADDRRRRALEPQELGLHLAAEGVVTPRAVAAGDAVTRNDDRHRIGAMRIPDGTRGAGMAHPPGERRVRVDLAERNTDGLREHAGLELAHAREIDRHREERPMPREVLVQLTAGALGMRARLGGRAVEAASGMETHDAALGCLDPELAN